MMLFKMPMTEISWFCSYLAVLLPILDVDSGVGKTIIYELIASVLSDKADLVINKS